MGIIPQNFKYFKDSVFKDLIKFNLTDGVALARKNTSYSIFKTKYPNILDSGSQKSWHWISSFVSKATPHLLS